MMLAAFFRVIYATYNICIISVFLLDVAIAVVIVKSLI